MRYPSSVILFCMALYLVSPLVASGGTVIPWQLQGWRYRALIVSPPSGWVIVDMSTPVFLNNVRPDLSDVRVMSSADNMLPFIVAEYVPGERCKLAIYVPDPPPSLIAIYWGVSQTSVITPAYLYKPDTENGGDRCCTCLEDIQRASGLQYQSLLERHV